VVFLSNINQFQYVIRARWLCGSVLVSNTWGRETESNSSLNIFFSFMQPSWITVPMSCIFRTSFTIHHCMALLQVAPVSTPLHKFVRPPCWYYRLEEIVKYNLRVVPNCITSIPNFIQIRPAVLELNHADRQTWPALYAFISCTSCKERMKTNIHGRISYVTSRTYFTSHLLPLVNTSNIFVVFNVSTGYIASNGSDYSRVVKEFLSKTTKTSQDILSGSRQICTTVQSVQSR
jgi:hypothetical protein